jgi:hypothetical protein
MGCEEERFGGKFSEEVLIVGEDRGKGILEGMSSSSWSSSLK